MSLLDFSRKTPDPEWTSYNEPCGVGDGRTTRFKVPFPAAEARKVLVLRNLDVAAPDAKTAPVLSEDGKVVLISPEPDGYQLTRDGEALYIDFERPVRLGVHVGVCCLGRKVGDAFRILPLTKQVRDVLQKKCERFQNGKKTTLEDIFQSGRVGFHHLVDAWTAKREGEPVPCVPDEKDELLEQLGTHMAIDFCGAMVDRARAIQEERVQALETDRGNF